MIGLSFFIGIALWTTVAVMISRRVPRWIGIAQHPTAVSVMVFPLVLIAPIADELIGRWQFSQACERYAVVVLSPDWSKVKRARTFVNPARVESHLLSWAYLEGGAIDLDTGETFFRHTTLQLRTYGFLLRMVSWDSPSSGEGTCSPKNLGATMEELRMNIPEELK